METDAKPIELDDVVEELPPVDDERQLGDAKDHEEVADTATDTIVATEQKDHAAEAEGRHNTVVGSGSGSGATTPGGAERSAARGTPGGHTDDEAVPYFGVTVRIQHW